MVYEEPKDYLEPGKSKDDGGREIMVQKCPAYGNPREVGIEMEQCQAYGPTLAVTQMFAIKQCLVTCIVL